MSNECVNQLLPPLYLQGGRKYLAPERGQNIPEFCTVIWRPWLTGQGRVLRDIRMQIGRMKRGNVTQRLSHTKFNHNSKTFFFCSPCLCPQPDPGLIPSLSEGEPVSRQVKHTLNSAGLSAINHFACSFPLTLMGPSALLCTRKIPANSSNF